MFDRLECSDRLAELLSLLAVVDSKLEHPFRCAQCIGGYQDRCSGGDFGDRLGRVGVEPPCRYVIQGDISGVSRAVQQRPGVKPYTAVSALHQPQRQISVIGYRNQKSRCPGGAQYAWYASV